MGHIFLDTDYGVDTIFHGLPPPHQSPYIYISLLTLFSDLLLWIYRTSSFIFRLYIPRPHPSLSLSHPVAAQNVR